jgi:hypothetical protein
MRFDGRGDREERGVEDLSLLEVGSQRSSMELHGRSKLGRVGAMESKLPEKKEFDKVQMRQSPVARTRGRQPPAQGGKGVQSLERLGQKKEVSLEVEIHLQEEGRGGEGSGDGRRDELTATTR